MSGHISWRDDIARTCADCGHHKGNHALADGPCLNLPVCPCEAFEPKQQEKPDD